MGFVFDHLWWFIGAFFVFAVIHAASKQAALAKAKAAYEAALAALSADSENNDKRIAALNAGRVYVDAARQAAGDKGRVVFDEIALQNDLTVRFGKAASAVQPPVANQNSATPEQSGSVDQLARLADLRAKGVLTPSEFAVAKKKVLGA
jgi:Short C-terminal domain